MSELMVNRENSAPAADEEPLTLWQVIASVFAAGFGVQSKENKVRDFSRGKPVHFIIAGLLFTVLFMLSLIVIINMVL